MCSFGWLMGFLNWVSLWCKGSYLIRFSVLLRLCVFFSVMGLLQLACHRIEALC